MYKIILKKFLKKEIFLYVIFGIATTLVNLISFYVMSTIFGWNENISNIIAILFAIICAYITNKDLVFHSKSNGILEKTIEFIKFVFGRIFTIILEFLGCFFLFKTSIPEMASKTAITVIVIILNFFISKYFTFKQ